MIFPTVLFGEINDEDDLNWAVPATTFLQARDKHPTCRASLLFWPIVTRKWYNRNTWQQQALIIRTQRTTSH